MAFNTFAQGQKIASDLANRAILAESSLTSLGPLASPLPTLQKAFPLYISAAEIYSHLLGSNLVPESERAGIKKKWRLVLDRAEKVKTRINELGGQVGKVDTGDEGEEEDIRRRGGRLNGLDLPLWRQPSDREFLLGTAGEFRDPVQPDLASEQVEMDAELAVVPREAWDVKLPNEHCVVTQGAGADCSAVAGIGVCLEHNRRWKRKLAVNTCFPSINHVPQPSDNGKHVIKLLLNGAWRGVIIDALLPRTKHTHYNLHATSHPIDVTPTPGQIGAPWIPLALKAFFKAHGGYSLRGSNPAPDVYAFTGWIPERCSLREGFRREKEWDRVHNAFVKGQVLVTLGSGQDAGKGLIPLHAYAVFDLREEDGQRVVDIFDPGLPAEAACSAFRAMADLTIGQGRKTGLFSMMWDEVCANFDALHLNWNPELRPVHAIRHWSWSKPDTSPNAQPRYRLTIQGGTGDVWLLLSQHLVSKDRAIDDIALHVVEEHSGEILASRPEQHEVMNPYSNAQHVLIRHHLHSLSSSLLVLPSRDRGIGRTDFTLQAFASAGSAVTLERIDRPLAFTHTIKGAISAKSAGGHSGWPNYGVNPQYRLEIGESHVGGRMTGNDGGRGAGDGVKAEVRIALSGDVEVPWNVKLLWSSEGVVHDVTHDAVVADSGAHSYGLAFAHAYVTPGVYTLAVSAFEPGQTGSFGMVVESNVPIKATPLPVEGAGMFHRYIQGEWSSATSGGRPSQNQYHLNPHIDLILPHPTSIQCRFYHPPSGVSDLGPYTAPLNLTLFQRKQGGETGDQIATSGPYSDTLSGVRIGRIKIEEGVHVLVPSLYERGEGRGRRWRVDVWGDRAFEMEVSSRSG